MLNLSRHCLAAVVLAALGLAGCETFDIAERPSDHRLPDGTAYARDTYGTLSAGRYKVGQPYQINGVWYYPKADYAYSETGIASWYGPGFDGRMTANGETYDQTKLTAAHPTLPLPSMVRVTNLENGRVIKVRINDRGPFKNGRIIDLSRRAADLLGFVNKGTTKVLVEIIPHESRQLASLALADQAAAYAPSAAPLVPVASRSLAPQTTAPADVQPAVPSKASRPPLRPPQVDGSITTTSVAPSRIYVQAGAFSRVDNAIRLRAKLAGLGKAYVARAKVDDRRLFRVRLGPVASVEEADRLLARLISIGHTDARVVID